MLKEGKATDKKLIESYIAFIGDYSKIAEAKKVISEEDYEQKYYALLKEWNDLVPGYNEVVKKYELQLETSEGLLQDIETRDIEINRIKTETIQLDNVSFKKLWTALFNLPAGQLIGILSTLMVLLISSFSLGTLYERTSSNNVLYDLRNSNKELNLQNEKLKYSLDNLKSSSFYIDTLKAARMQTGKNSLMKSK